LGLGISALAGVFSSDAQRVPSRKDGTRVGDEGKAAVFCPSRGGFAVSDNPTIRSVITVTELRFFITSRV
jgi:hypothetical protein